MDTILSRIKWCAYPLIGLNLYAMFGAVLVVFLAFSYPRGKRYYPEELYFLHYANVYVIYGTPFAAVVCYRYLEPNLKNIKHSFAKWGA